MSRPQAFNPPIHQQPPPGAGLPVMAEAPPAEFHRQLTPEQMFAELAHRMTELSGELRGNFLNNVLFEAEIALVQDPSLANVFVYERQFEVSFASLAVWNSSAQLVTVETQGRQSAIPASGLGVKRINAGRMAVWPAVGNLLTVYAPAATTVTLAVYNRPQPPAGGDA